MSEQRVAVEWVVGAPTELVYCCIPDFDRYHPQFLPPAILQFRVEEGGVQTGRVHRFCATAGSRTDRIDQPAVKR